MPRKVSKDWNTYETVKSGEVCSILTAKKLGIYDHDAVFKEQYDDIKTYAKYVSDDAARTKKLCNQNMGGTSSYVPCEVEFGPGYTRKPGTVDQCMTVDCPPNFKAGPNGSCVKPVMPFLVSAASKCEEKSYDWYTVNDYHLGNRYQFVGNTCQAPCPSKYVPNMATDRVDNDKVSSQAKDDLGQCIHKKEYFSGKYNFDQDFCPISWVMRMNATPSLIEKEIRQGLPEYLSGNVEKSSVGQQIQDHVKKTATTVVNECNALLENVIDGSDAMKRACRKISTKERLLQAHKICEQVDMNPDSITERWKKELNESDDRIKDKLNVMKQACDAVFCESKTDQARLLGRRSICFDKVPKISPTVKPPVNASEGTFQRGTFNENVQTSVMNLPIPSLLLPYYKTLQITPRRLVQAILMFVLLVIFLYMMKYLILFLLNLIGVQTLEDFMGSAASPSNIAKYIKQIPGLPK